MDMKLPNDPLGLIAGIIEDLRRITHNACALELLLGEQGGEQGPEPESEWRQAGRYSEIPDHWLVSLPCSAEESEKIGSAVERNHQLHGKLLTEPGVIFDGMSGHKAYWWDGVRAWPLTPNPKPRQCWIHRTDGVVQRIGQGQTWFRCRDGALVRYGHDGLIRPATDQEILDAMKGVGR